MRCNGGGAPQSLCRFSRPDACTLAQPPMPDDLALLDFSMLAKARALGAVRSPDKTGNVSSSTDPSDRFECRGLDRMTEEAPQVDITSSCGASRSRAFMTK